MVDGRRMGVPLGLGQGKLSISDLLTQRSGSGPRRRPSESLSRSTQGRGLFASEHVQCGPVRRKLEGTTLPLSIDE